MGNQLPIMNTQGLAQFSWARFGGPFVHRSTEYAWTAATGLVCQCQPTRHGQPGRRLQRV